MALFKSFSKSIPTKGLSKGVSSFASKAKTVLKRIPPKKAALGASVLVGGGILASNSIKDGKFDLASGFNTTVKDGTGIVTNAVGTVIGGAGTIASGAVDVAGDVAGDAINTAGNVAGDALNTAGNVAGDAISGVFGSISGYLPYIAIIAAIIAFIYIKSIFR